MAQEISLFSGYSQKENLVSNYTGLLFKLIYEENPELFEELIQEIFPTISIGPKFSQQSKARESVFDLVVEQEPFSVVIETKLSDWFYDNQLTRHLNGMKEKYKYQNVFLLLLSNFSPVEQLKYDKRFPEAEKIAKGNGITIQQLSFESLIELLKELNLSAMLERFVKEYEELLIEKNLIATWKNEMMALAVGDTIELNTKFNIYYCPRGKRGLFQYLGLYSNKNISRIGKVKKIVDITLIDGKLESEVFYSENGENLLREEEIKITEMIEEAKKVKHYVSEGHRFYIVEEFKASNYEKISSGGMQSAKRFNLLEILGDKFSNKDLSGIIEKLNKLKWK